MVERTVEALDEARQRRFPVEIWRPADSAEPRPLVVFSHSAMGGRRQSSVLCSHLASHGYVVAAPDHSELVARELARRAGETAEQAAARMQRWIESRVPDLRFVLDALLARALSEWGIAIDAGRAGAVGHSFGGWTVLEAAADTRIHSVVALGPRAGPIRGRASSP